MRYKSAIRFTVYDLRERIKTWIARGSLIRTGFTSRQVRDLAQRELSGDARDYTVSQLNHALRSLVQRGTIVLSKRGNGGNIPAKYKAFVTAALLSLVMALPSEGASPSKAEVALWLAIAGDLASTEVALHNGLRELNPLQKNRAVRIGTHVAYGVIATWYQRKHPDKNILLFPTIMYTSLTAWNVGVTLHYTW